MPTFNNTICFVSEAKKTLPPITRFVVDLVSMLCAATVVERPWYGLVLFIVNSDETRTRSQVIITNKKQSRQKS